MFSRSKTAILSLILAASAITSIQSITPAYAVVGDTLATIDMEPIIDAYNHFCSIGVAFDGVNLYTDGCFDSSIYKITTGGALVSTIDYGTLSGGMSPNAMAYHISRNGLWIGQQDCVDDTGDGTGDMRINFLDFDTGVVTTEFVIDGTYVNPATAGPFLDLCFIDGLAFNVNNIADPSDDELWISDDIANGPTSGSGLIRTNTAGVVLTAYDPTTVDAAIGDFGQSGLAVGGADLYMGNNGGGQVFRADEGSDPLVKIDDFVSTGIRAEDMECDPFTKAPVEGMWVRNSPQGEPADNLLRLFEIEPQTCNPIPPAVGGVVLPTDAMALMGLAILSQPIWLVLLLVPAGAAFAAINFRKSYCH